MKKQVLLLFLFSLLLVSSVFGAFRYSEPYYGGYGSGSFSNYFDMFLDFLESNEYVIDAIVFLIIFLILAKKVFGETFAKDKALYVVIGIALTIGILMYERRLCGGGSGCSLIINSGWLAILALFVFGIYVLSSGEMAGMRLFLISGISLAFIWWLYISYPNVFEYYIPPILFFLAVILLIIGTFIGFIQAISGKWRSSGGGK